MATVRLADIAKLAKVSEASVSRVLNGRPGVSPRMRQAVLTALEETGAVTGQVLRRSERLIGLVTPELTNTLVATMVQELERAIQRYGYVSVVCAREPGSLFTQEPVDVLVERGVAGIVFVSSWPEAARAWADALTGLHAQRLPYVLFNSFGEQGEAPFVAVDDQAAIRMAVKHLAALGHERIGLVVGRDSHLSFTRTVKGFISTLNEFRCLKAEEGTDFVYRALPTPEGGRAAVGGLVNIGCTAILCDGDLTALGAIQTLTERGLSVPEHISVMTLSDSRYLEFVRPPLTAVRQPVESMALAAVDLLLEDVTTNGPAQHPAFAMLPELIVRRSTAARCPTVDTRPGLLGRDDQGSDGGRGTACVDVWASKDSRASDRTSLGLTTRSRSSTN